MRKFKFKLEAVLLDRKRVEDFRLREWVMAQRILQGIRDDLAVLERRLERAIREATQTAEVAEGKFGAAILMSVDGFIAGTKTRIGWKRREVERGEKLTEKKRLEYVQASQKRKALEKLKERRHAEYRSEGRKAEARALDDLYIMAAPRHHADDREETEVRE